MFELDEQALEVFGTALVTYIKKQLIAKKWKYGPPDSPKLGNKIATGELYDSFSSSVVNENGLPVLVLEYGDYFKYVDKGRLPHARRVPLQFLIAWIKVRGLKPRTKKGRFAKVTDKSIKGLAFAVQTNIYKYGIRPTYIYDKALDEFEEVLQDFPNNVPQELIPYVNDIYDAVANDINIFLNQMIERELVINR
jgi:hypothetical protein